MSFKKLLNIYRKSKGKWYFFGLGLLATLWFLIRVIPKPVRAGYPCQRAALPLASAFVLYISSGLVAVDLFRKVMTFFRQYRYLPAFIGITGIVLLALIQLALNPDKVFSSPLEEAAFTSNQPLGGIPGAMSGRVVWAWNPDVVDEDCPNTYREDKNWYMPEYTSFEGVNEMLSKGLQSLTSEAGISGAWDVLFKNFNVSKGKGNFGYSAGEKIAVKTNFVTCDASNMDGHDKVANLNMIDVSPQLIWSVLNHLINKLGVAQENISIGDPSAFFPNQYYDMLSEDFPDVVYLSLEDAPGRKGIISSDKELIQFSDGSGGDFLPTDFVEADYMINLSVVKHHGSAGFSNIAKNHYGSNMQNTAMHMHSSLVSYQSGMNHYRHLVDLLAHEHLGGKTILNIGDMLWGSANAWSGPVKFEQTPFNNDYPSSLLLAADPVAIESVALDFIRSEIWDDQMATSSGVNDFLVQAADPSARPIGIEYDPEADGSILNYSLGVYEHWNNSTDKAYSKNLGTGEGIELVKVFLSGVPDSEAEYEVISFIDIKPEGFPLQFCWNSLGVDPYDNVYIAFGEDQEWEGHDEDMALFFYNHDNDEKRFLDTYNNVLDKAENREEGEVVSKGHTDIVYMDGRMYIGTQPYTSPVEDLDDYRGSHLLAYDIELDSIIDLSRNLPDGVVQKNRGLLAITTIPSLNYIVGLGNPHGDLVYYNTVTESVDRVVPGDRVNSSITRNIVPKANGDITYSWGWERMYIYDYDQDNTIRTDYKGGEPFWNGLARTQDGSTAYISDPEGTIYVLDVDGGSLETLGNINPSGGTILSLVLSEDESKLYSIPGVQPYQLLEMDVQTGETRVAVEFPDEFGLEDYSFTGNNVRDSKGRFYFARHQLKSGNSDGRYDGELVIIDLEENTSLPSNLPPEFDVIPTFQTEVKDQPDTIYVTNINDGDGNIQNLEISISKGNTRNISSLTVKPDYTSGTAIITFIARDTGRVDLEIKLSDDGTGRSGGQLSITKTVDIQITNSTSVQDMSIDQVMIFPNPASQWLHIRVNKSEFFSLSLYNQEGKKVMEEDVPLNSGQIDVDVSALEHGVYFIELKGKEKRITGKQIISKTIF